MTDQIVRIALALILAFGLVACSSDDDEPDIGPRAGKPMFVEDPVDELYNDAMDELTGGIYRIAAAKFDEVERQHPYSAWARRAMLMSAYAHYLDQNYSAAILAAERFLTLHPGNKDAPYALYLTAISYYEQISDVERDQRMTQLALDQLNEVVQRYPETEYARDAQLKIDLARDHLAGKEMQVGRYYLVRDQTIAAIGRFRTVVLAYQTTTHVPEALYRLVECYLTIGLMREAQAAGAVLGFNYPGNEWYEDAFELLRESGLQPDPKGGQWLFPDTRPKEVVKAEQEAAAKAAAEREVARRAAMGEVEEEKPAKGSALPPPGHSRRR